MPKKTHFVAGDIKPYRSMIDGSIIDGRKAHREHLKRHGCVEVGNSIPKEPRGIPDTSPRERLELIRHQVNQLGEQGLRKMIQRDVRNRRDNPRQYMLDRE